MLPLRRTKHVLVENLGEELVVCLTKEHKVHCLNRTAAQVWRHCDGKTPVTALAELLARELGVAADEALVLHALGKLQAARLLEEAGPLPGVGVSRRALVKGGLVGVAATVASLLTPTPAAAASCLPDGACVSPVSAGDCCSGGACPGFGQCGATGTFACCSS